MSDLISREALKDKYLCCGWLPEMSKDQFDAFPAVDAVEVVRCKDCEAYQPTEGGKPLCVVHQIAVCAVDFCSYGKRRESEVSE